MEDPKSLILVMITTICIASIIVISLMPRLLLLILVRIAIHFSQFRKRKYVQIDDHIQACYMERGKLKESKASVLLLHGFNGASTDFLEAIPLIDKDYHVIALDYLNHGQSSSLNGLVKMKDMVQFIEKFSKVVGLNQRKFHIFGFSLGGAITGAFTAAHPELVASLTMACPAGVYLEKPDFALGNMSKKQFKDFLDLISLNKLKIPFFIFNGMYADVQANLGRYTNVDEGILTEPTAFKLTPTLLKSIQVNTLILWGDNDKLCLTKGFKHLKEHLPNSTVEFIKDSGHVILLTHLKETTDIINNWLSKQTSMI